LALAIRQGLAEVSSVLGSGSTFSAVLPKVFRAPVADAEESPNGG
jgi:hypothetical protein